MWLLQTNYDKLEPALSCTGVWMYSAYWKGLIHSQIRTLIKRYNKILTVSLVLNYPEWMGSESIASGSEEVNKWIIAMKRACEQIYGKESMIGYVGLREFGDALGKKHYHCLLHFNGEKVKGLGNIVMGVGVNRIIETCWAEQTEGRVSYDTKMHSIMITKRGVEKQLVVMDKEWIEYICKLHSKRADGMKNILIPYYDYEKQREEEKIDKDVLYREREQFYQGLAKYRYPLLMRVKVKGVCRGVLWTDEIHRLSLEKRKGGISYVLVSEKEEGGEYMIMLSGYAYKTISRGLMGIMAQALENVTGRDRGDCVKSIEVVSYHRVKGKWQLGYNVIRKGLEKYYLKAMLLIGLEKSIKIKRKYYPLTRRKHKEENNVIAEIEEKGMDKREWKGVEMIEILEENRFPAWSREKI